MTECKAVVFYNEDLDNIDPVFTVASLELPFFQEETAISIMVDGVILGAAGISKAYKGVGHGWCMMDKRLPDNCKGKVAKLIREAFERGMAEYGFHRVQADVQTHFDKGHRFVKFIGMEFEGVMKAFGPDKEDYARYALVRC